MSHPATADRGEATTQLVVLTPVLVLIVMTLVQTAVWFHVANIASAAAAEGAAAASRYGAQTTEGVDTARQLVDEAGSHLVRAPAVQRDAGFVTVTVEISVPSIIPFFPSSVHRRAIEPIERFIGEPQRDAVFHNRDLEALSGS